MDTAWAAGFFDGEGSVQLLKPGQHRMGMVVASISNTDEEVLKRFQERWGGNLCAYKNVTSNRSKPAWRWQITSRSGSQFLREIEPHIRLRKNIERIRVALEFQGLRVAPGKRPSDEARKRSEELFLEMRELNSRNAGGLYQM